MSRIVRRGPHPVRLRRIRVKQVTDLAPRYRRIVFASAELEGFGSDAPDDHVKLFFPDGDGGVPSIVDDAARARMRDFTPRAFDAVAGELTIDFALHGAGIANAWASAAKPGDEIAVGGPRGSMLVAYEFDWYVLAGDETALPAIARRLEELPPNAPVQVLVEVERQADELPLRTFAAAEVSWIHREEGACLAEAVRDLALPPGEGFVFAAGESAAIREVRGHLAQKGHPRDAQIVSAYWKHGAADFHEAR